MASISALRAVLVERVGKDRFDLWFGESTELTIFPDRMVVTAPNSFFQEWLRRNFREHLEAAALQVLGRTISIEFQVRGTGNAAIATTGDLPTPGDAAKIAIAAGHAAESSHGLAGSCRERGDGDSPHDAQILMATLPMAACKQPPARTTGRRFAKLQNFVAGESNRLAYTTADLVVGQLGRWSPFVVHGPTGVGKTHLLEGIWSAVRQKRTDAVAVFLTAEQFTTHFLEALRGSGLPSFRRKYRGVDLLIIDDLQFFAGKRATLIELLYTINTLAEEGRQVVLAADRSPSELTDLGQELVHRLNGGMVCRIDLPDYEVRQGIVRQVAAKMNLTLPEDVVEFVTGNLTSHARELIGAINRMQAAQIVQGAPITLESAREALAEMVRYSGKVVRLRDIESAVCHVFGLETETLQSDRRAREVSYPRMLAMWLARKHTRAALSEIGHYFGHRTHSTVVSAQKKVTTWLQKQELMHLEGGQCTVDEAIRRVERAMRAG